jgi:hypothetical protein
MSSTETETPFRMKVTAEMIQGRVLPGDQFILLVWEPNGLKSMEFISNVPRETSITAMEEFIKKEKQRTK